MKVEISREGAIVCAKAVKAALAPFCARIEVAGSLRRQAAQIGDLDFVLILKPGCTPGTLAGTTGGDRRRRTEIGPFKVDLLITQPQSIGAALMHATGPWWLTVAQRRVAKRRGLRLNEYGLWDRTTGRHVASETESGIYAELGLAWLEPAERGARVVEIARFASASAPGQEHIVEAGPAGIRCSCRGFTFHGRCWHVANSDLSAAIAAAVAGFFAARA